MTGHYYTCWAKGPTSLVSLGGGGGGGAPTAPLAAVFDPALRAGYSPAWNVQPLTSVYKGKGPEDQLACLQLPGHPGAMRLGQAVFHGPERTP
jgi:hypothetical protein